MSTDRELAGLGVQTMIVVAGTAVVVWALILLSPVRLIVGTAVVCSAGPIAAWVRGPE